MCLPQGKGKLRIRLKYKEKGTKRKDKIKWEVNRGKYLQTKGGGGEAKSA
jgi:hypothetical protein